ncbi:MAG: hypothetical protein STHCBS139747_007136 [Sporothrix thermara]
MSSFGPVYVVGPRPGHLHTHTAVLLHGRGSTGEEFADELFGTALSDVRTPSLADCLPTWRWVFPSSPSAWSATFEEWMPAWFEAHSLADPAARQDLQQPGLEASAQHTRDMLDEERQRLQSNTGLADVDTRLVLGGISLGGAVALWTLLGTDAPTRALGGFVAVSAWLPFAQQVHALLVGDRAGAHKSWPRDDTILEPMAFVSKAMASLSRFLLLRQKASTAPATSVLATPVFLGHGRDDAYVHVQLGRQAYQLLTDAGFTSVEWQVYEGAEQEGHWLKEPEEMDDLARFLSTIAGSYQSVREDQNCECMRTDM